MLHLAKFGICAGALSLAATVHGSISFNIAAGTLRDSAGDPITGGLIILAVDTNRDGFLAPDASNFLREDDMEVARWDFAEGGDVPGEFLASKVIGDYDEANWTAGDPLALFWYPEKSTADLVPGIGAKFGAFADPDGESTGDGWTMPADNVHLYSLQFFATGSVLNTVAFASSYLATSNLTEGTELDALVDASPVPAKTAPDTNTIQWTPSSAASSYEIQRRIATDEEGGWEVIGAAGGGETEFADGTLKAGLVYEYRIIVENGFFTLGSLKSISLQSERSKFANVSARGKVLASEEKTKLAGGVIVIGDGAEKNLVMQALGIETIPIPSFLADPIINVNKSGIPFTSNDNWLAASNALDIEQAMADGNAVPISDSVDAKDATVLFKGEKGVGYTFETESVIGEDGEILMGIFDADSDALGLNDTRIRNLSARAYIDANDVDAIVAGGLIIEGNVSKQVLVMAWGQDYLARVDPSLDGLTVASPKLILRELSDGDTILAENSSWETQTGTSASGIEVETDPAVIAEVIRRIGYPEYESGATDSALLVTLPAGAYTFELDGNGGSGIALIAIEEVEMDI